LTVSKSTQLSNFTKICPVQVEVFHTNGQMNSQTWMTLTVPFYNFANAPKNHK